MQSNLKIKIFKTYCYLGTNLRFPRIFLHWSWYIFSDNLEQQQQQQQWLIKTPQRWPRLKKSTSIATRQSDSSVTPMKSGKPSGLWFTSTGSGQAMELRRSTSLPTLATKPTRWCDAAMTPPTQPRRGRRWRRLRSIRFCGRWNIFFQLFIQSIYWKERTGVSIIDD